jgi:hypothetical protein
VANAIIADVASMTTKTADIVVVVVSRVPPPHLVAPVPLGRCDDAIASPVQWSVSIGCDDGGRDDGGSTMIVAVHHDADDVRWIHTIECVGDPSKALVEASDA